MTSIASGENNNLETWKQILESVFDNQKLNTTIFTGIVNGSSVEFVKQTGSEEQPGLIKINCLKIFTTALASSLGRVVWVPFALLSVFGTRPNFVSPPEHMVSQQRTLCEG